MCLSICLSICLSVVHICRAATQGHLWVSSLRALAFGHPSQMGICHVDSCLSATHTQAHTHVHTHKHTHTHTYTWCNDEVSHADYMKRYATQQSQFWVCIYLCQLFHLSQTQEKARCVCRLCTVSYLTALYWKEDGFGWKKKKVNNTGEKIALSKTGSIDLKTLFVWKWDNVLKGNEGMQG